MDIPRFAKDHRDDHLGFADDWTAPGPTLISTSTLETVASWFEDLDVEENRRRLRVNLEIDGLPAFWEDKLYGSTEGDLVKLRIGAFELLGENSRQRCPFPRRDVETGERTAKFNQAFTEGRKETLQPWAYKERFDHSYRVAIHTIPGAIDKGAKLRGGDTLEILGSIQSQ